MLDLSSSTPLNGDVYWRCHWVDKDMVGQNDARWEFSEVRVFQGMPVSECKVAHDAHLNHFMCIGYLLILLVCPCFAFMKILLYHIKGSISSIIIVALF